MILILAVSRPMSCMNLVLCNSAVKRQSAEGLILWEESKLFFFSLFRQSKKKVSLYFFVNKPLIIICQCCSPASFTKRFLLEVQSFIFISRMQSFWWNLTWHLYQETFQRWIRILERKRDWMGGGGVWRYGKREGRLKSRFFIEFWSHVASKNLCKLRVLSVGKSGHTLEISLL